MAKHYGFKNENNPVKNTYELTILETVVPIENPTGRLHRLARSILKNNAPRAHYMQNHTFWEKRPQARRPFKAFYLDGSAS